MASPPILDDPNQAARRAKTRIAVATVLLAVAIGGLTLLSRQHPAEKTDETATQKQESISSSENALPEEPPSPAQISSAEQETQQQPPAPAAETPPVQPAPPQQPAVAPPPPPPTLPSVKPQQSLPQPAMPSTKKAATPVKAASEPPPTITEAPPAPPAEKPAKPSLQKKPMEAVAQKPLPAQPTPATTKPVAPPKSYDVQVGVFTDMDNAKQLQAKLAENGIPSHTETKLQVGPFNTKAEAEAAREKLKNLGIGSVVVPGK